jgi:hypothetical protein
MMSLIVLTLAIIISIVDTKGALKDLSNKAAVSGWRHLLWLVDFLDVVVAWRILIGIISISCSCQRLRFLIAVACRGVVVVVGHDKAGPLFSFVCLSLYLLLSIDADVPLIEGKCVLQLHFHDKANAFARSLSKKVMVDGGLGIFDGEVSCVSTVHSTGTF